MTLKYALLAGAALMLAPVTAGTALAADDDTYVCNGQLCHDDQADDTRALNERALQQAREDNDDDDDSAYSPARGVNMYGDGDDDDRAYGPARGADMYGDDDDDDDGMSPYDDDDADDDGT